MIEKITNVGIFIPHRACPNKCAFCNQHIITGVENEVGADEVKNIIDEQIPYLEKHGYKAEIAFFGGTFTALPIPVMSEYLETASGYIKQFPKIFTGIRCSTRPDCVNENIIDILKEFSVTAVELGAQSMDEIVLNANKRGHTAADTIRAAGFIKSSGISLGLQMMTGLYKDTVEKSLKTADEFIRLKPDTVRIYPTVIMPNTELCDLYQKGEYTTFSFDETVNLCADLYEKFVSQGIKVIRIGLDTSDYVEKNMLGGNYHQAMGEICISRYYYKKIVQFMENTNEKNIMIYADKRYFSKLCGHNGENRKRLAEKNLFFKLKEKPGAEPQIGFSEMEKACFLKP